MTQNKWCFDQKPKWHEVCFPYWVFLAREALEALHTSPLRLNTLVGKRRGKLYTLREDGIIGFKDLRFNGVNSGEINVPAVT